MIINYYIKKEKLSTNYASDLASGTGLSTYFLANNFKNVYAIDKSASMLEKAKYNFRFRKNIIYKNENFLSFNNENKSSIILCASNSVNYITTNEDLILFFKNIEKNLCKGGIFIFDVTSEYSFKELSKYTEIFQSNNKFYYLIYQYDIKTKFANSLFISYKGVEEHNRRFISISDFKNALSDTNLEIIDIFNLDLVSFYFIKKNN